MPGLARRLNPTRILPRCLRRLRREEDGATVVEFAFVFPVFILAVLGTLETAIVIFISSSIEAAVLEASRYGITGGTIPGVTREERVLDIVGDKTYGLVDMDLVGIDTLVYESFDDIGQPEPFEDANLNVVYDTGELFTDVNGNGQWDADMGAAGLGGPSDVVVYRVTYAWGIMTPLIRSVIGEGVLHASSVAVRNEPY
jgi:Flp pilus assembly pilin Flp